MRRGPQLYGVTSEALMRALEVGRRVGRDEAAFEQSMRKVEETMAIDFNWWQVRLDMLPLEASAAPADLASSALAALEDRALSPYLRGAAVAVIDGALDVRCDVIARSAGAAQNIVENTVALRVPGRAYQGGARRVRA